MNTESTTGKLTEVCSATARSPWCWSATNVYVALKSRTQYVSPVAGQRETPNPSRWIAGGPAGSGKPFQILATAARRRFVS